jgi:hypothetical protein
LIKLLHPGFSEAVFYSEKKMTFPELLAGLRRFYWMALGPALTALGLVAVFFEAPSDTHQTPRSLAVAFLVAGGVSAVALPLWQRILFGRKTTPDNPVNPDSFIGFQKRFMLSGLLAVYVIPLGFVCRIAQVPLFWIIIFALYAVYYYYPSKRRIMMDCRIFRVQGIK